MPGKYSYSFIKLTDVFTECLSCIRSWDSRKIITSALKDSRIECGIQADREAEMCEEYSILSAVEVNLNRLRENVNHVLKD